MNSYQFKLNNKKITINISELLISMPFEDMDKIRADYYNQLLPAISQTCVAIIKKQPKLEEHIELIFNDFLDKEVNTLAYTGTFKVDGIEAWYVLKKPSFHRPKRLPDPCPKVKEPPLNVEELKLPEGHEKEIHPHANIFPYMNEHDFTNLYKSIGENGLLEPIKLYKGMVIDGRNRLRACRIAGVEPQYQDIETENTLEYVLSTNQHRRHLSTSQKAVIAAMVSKQEKNVSQSEMAKAMNISLRSVASASVIINKAEPEVRKSLQAGHLTLNLASKISTLKPDEQRRAVKTPVLKRKKYIKSKLTEQPQTPKEKSIKLTFSEKEMFHILKHTKDKSLVSEMIKELVLTELGSFMERGMKPSS